jgi:hypothetical protein
MPRDFPQVSLHVIIKTPSKATILTTLAFLTESLLAQPVLVLMNFAVKLLVEIQTTVQTLPELVIVMPRALAVVLRFVAK